MCVKVLVQIFVVVEELVKKNNIQHESGIQFHYTIIESTPFYSNRITINVNWYKVANRILCFTIFLKQICRLPNDVECESTFVSHDNLVRTVEPRLTKHTVSSLGELTQRLPLSHWRTISEFARRNSWNLSIEFWDRTTLYKTWK